MRKDNALNQSPPVDIFRENSTGPLRPWRGELNGEGGIYIRRGKLTEPMINNLEVTRSSQDWKIVETHAWKPTLTKYIRKEDSVVEQSFDDGINENQRPSEGDQSAKKWRRHKTLFNWWNWYAADHYVESSSPLIPTVAHVLLVSKCDALGT